MEENMKKLLVIALVLCFTFASVFAQGAKEAKAQTSTDPADCA